MCVCVCVFSNDTQPISFRTVTSPFFSITPSRSETLLDIKSLTSSTLDKRCVKSSFSAASWRRDVSDFLSRSVRDIIDFNSEAESLSAIEEAKVEVKGGVGGGKGGCDSFLASGRERRERPRFRREFAAVVICCLLGVLLLS